MSSGVAVKAYTSGFGPHMVPVTIAGEPHVAIIETKDMGKCPGERNSRGEWFPVAVNAARCTTTEQAEKWDSWGANVGLALGREAGLYAFDSDIDDPQAAQTVRAVLERELPPDTPMRSVSDPTHNRFLFMVRVTGTKPSGSKLVYTKGSDITGIDLLGEGKQFVAWGTHNKTGKPYQWSANLFDYVDGVTEVPSVTFEDLAQIIEEIDKAMLMIGWQRVSGKVSAHTGTGTASRRTGTEYELNRWLALVPNTDADHEFDDRSQWIAMCHAIHGASGGTDWGRETWLRWCEQRAQQPGEPERAWDTLPDGGYVDLDFIREKARQKNSTAAAQLDFEMAPQPDENLIEALAKAAKAGALWPAVLERFVFVSTQDKFYDLRSMEAMPRSAIEMVLGRHFEKLKSEDPVLAQMKQLRNVPQLLARHPGVQIADNFTYWPGRSYMVADDAGRTLLNTWRKARYLHKANVSENDIRPWLDHVEYVCGDKATAAYFIKWLAFVVKLPGEKPNHHPLFVTKPGVGKDTMLVPVIYAVGERNAREVSADDLSNQWTDYLEYRLVFVSETRQHSRGNKSSHDVMNDLKTFLADKPAVVGVHRKGKDKYVIPNLTAWVFFSNEQMPVYLAEGDRRIWVIDNSAADKKDPAYYEKLHKWLEANKHLVASYLMDYTLTNADVQRFKGAAPDTTAKQRLIAANRDPVLVEVEQIIEDAKNGVGHPTLVVTLEDVEADLKNRVRRMPSRSMLGRYMRQAGARPVSEGAHGEAQPVKGAGMKRLWVLAELDAQGRSYAGLEPREAAELFNLKAPPKGARETSTGTTLRAVNDDEI